jgi:hypothetical protein
MVEGFGSTCSFEEVVGFQATRQNTLGRFGKSKSAVHEDASTDGGSSGLSDSESSTVSGTPATTPLVPGLQDQQHQQHPVGPTAVALQQQTECQQQKQKGQVKKSRVQQVSSLRASLRSKGNCVISEVSGINSSSGASPFSGVPAELPAWLVPSNQHRPSLYAREVAGISAATAQMPQQQQPRQQRQHLQAQVNSLPHEPVNQQPIYPSYSAGHSNSVLVRTHGADASARGPRMPPRVVPTGTPSVGPPPGLEDFATSLGPTCHGMASPGVATEHDYECSASLYDYPPAASIPMPFDPMLPVKKRISSFLTEEPTSYLLGGRMYQSYDV